MKIIFRYVDPQISKSNKKKCYHTTSRNRCENQARIASRSSRLNRVRSLEQSLLKILPLEGYRHHPLFRNGREHLTLTRS
jgi:hypothetical protein